MVVLSLIQIIISYFNNYFTVKLKYKIIYSFSQFLADKIKYARKIKHLDNNGVYLQERIRTDVKVMVDIFFDSLVQIIVKSSALIMIFYLVSKINTQLLLIFFIAIPIYSVVYFIFKDKLFSISGQAREKLNKFIGIFSKQLEQIKFIKTHALYDETGQLAQKSFNEALSTLEKQVKIQFFYYSGGWIVKMLSFSALMIWGTQMIFKKMMTVGGLSAGIEYLNQFIDNIGFFLHLGEGLQSIKVSLIRINEILSLEQEPKGIRTLNSIKEIRIKNLSYKLDDGTFLFRNLNCNFTLGKIYCIKGHNGAGKSTFLSILVGIEKANTGDVFYDQISLSDLDMIGARKKNISYVEQRPFLYFSNIRNILLLNHEEEINLNGSNLLKAGKNLSLFFPQNAYFENEILSHDLTTYPPHDFDSILSGGEKQKLALVRAFTKDTEVLILDEPTASLDEPTTEIFIKWLKRIAVNKIVIVVTHDKKILQNADELLSL